MSALVAERIKLFSTSSPWWCSALAIVVVVGLTGAAAAVAPDGAGPMPDMLRRQFLMFGLVIVAVMAAVAVTTEYRFSTIRTTFQAMPLRTITLLAKSAVVAVAAGVVGLVASFGAWAAASWLLSDTGIAPAGAGQWREVAGAGLVFAVTAVLAVAVGVLLRQTAGAVALLLVWILLVENLVQVIPNVGDDLYRWMPFVHGFEFLFAGPAAGGAEQAMPFGPWGSLVYFAAVTAAVLAAALVVANRRDA